MSSNISILKPINNTKKRKSLPMNETDQQQPIDETSTNENPSNRRSQRRRMNVQSAMRSSSLTTTILNENISASSCLAETSKENDYNQTERRSSPKIDDQFVLTMSKDNPKLSFWTVTDRQAEWYKLTVPIQPSSSSNALTASSRLLPKIFQRTKSNSHSQESNDEITDTTQLIMKVIMHELDYDMDDDDLRFLQELNSTRDDRTISEDDFENAMIILEYYTAEQIRLQLKQKSCEDENIVCDVCLLPDADDGNEMVFCERCNACVHQNCYGITVVPSGTWLCKSCSVVRRPACLLCPKFGGPMKCTPSGTIWCHLTCALWLPELKFGDYAKMEPILNLNKIPHARWTLRCIVCSSSDGACVQCAHKNCRTPFHVTCGLSAGYFLDVQQTSSDETRTSRSQFNAYCLKHSDEARQRAEPCDGEQTPSIPLTVYRRQQLKIEQWLPQCYENFSDYPSSSHLNKQCPQDYDEDLSKILYSYWKMKRQKNHNKPLIPRIDFVLEQRENAELLLAQVNFCLKLRQKIAQLEYYSRSTLSIPNFSNQLTQRLDRLKFNFIQRDSRGLIDENRSIYTNRYYRHLIQETRSCIVGLETTFRDGLELNTTYVIGQTLDGEMMLLPKQLIAETNVITMNDDDEQVKPVEPEIIEDDERSSSPVMERTFQMNKTVYACYGNLVTCVTGSFD